MSNCEVILPSSSNTHTVSQFKCEIQSANIILHYQEEILAMENSIELEPLMSSSKCL